MAFMLTTKKTRLLFLSIISLLILLIVYKSHIYSYNYDNFDHDDIDSNLSSMITSNNNLINDKLESLGSLDSVGTSLQSSQFKGDNKDLSTSSNSKLKNNKVDEEIDDEADTTSSIASKPNSIAGSDDKQKDLTEKPGEEFSPKKELNAILSISPVVIFSKSYCPYSNKLKELLKHEYEIVPEPSVVELDKHKHGNELQVYLGEISGRKTVPNLFINGASRGGCDDLTELHSKNELLPSLVKWGGKDIKVSKLSVPSNS
ncbi:glutaredoxin [Ascoidea rubescens DSM 1968]|uniref:Glutaredoxin n=1 Tax=Ascoidea rubescens DSM 1968 TaxID=1344418 RepID=A0A1D2VGT7_9ASCO|nr:glutaredoxin [Ascoidea rubescens DSM 1968]ODV60760.1 glutaredoxin [Ascoidea rubescens DSM 1968]